MDRSEAYKLAQQKLLEAEELGYEVAAKLATQAGTTTLESGQFGIDIAYSWANKKGASVKVTCTVTSRNWYKHEQIQESIVLCI